MFSIKRTLTVVATLGFALSGLAALGAGRNDGSRSIQLSESTQILGVTVPPGTYTLKWTREHGSEEVRIEIDRGRKVVGAGKGLWIESEMPSRYEALVYRGDESGTPNLAEILFKGSADSILIEADTDSAQAQADAR